MDIRDGIAIVANFLLIGGLVFGGFTLFAQYHATGRWAKNITNLLAGMGMLTLAFALTLKPRNVDVLARIATTKAPSVFFGVSSVLLAGGHRGLRTHYLLAPAAPAPRTPAATRAEPRSAEHPVRCRLSCRIWPENRYNPYLPSQLGNRLELLMAQVCEVCGKKPQFGNNISHAHNVQRRRWNVNLRPVHAKVQGGAKRMRVCTSCLRSGKVTKA